MVPRIPPGTKRHDEDDAVTRAVSGGRASVMRNIVSAENILALATSLLRQCRRELAQLTVADGDVSSWARREALRRDCQALFERADDEQLDEAERSALADLARDAMEKLHAVVVARTIADALDAALGDRLLPMFIDRKETLEPDAPVPTPHPDWRNLTPTPNSDPWALDGRLDALPHLRLAGEWARHVRVTLDGTWRTWHLVPQLERGDRLACATPNDSFDELTWDRDSVEERAVFFNVRPSLTDAEQTRRCIALLDLARRKRVRVVAFPELSVPDKVLAAIERWLSRQRTVDMVVAGSRHRPARDGRWHNQATILMRGSKTRLTHRKFRPFAFFDRSETTGGRVKRTEHLSLTEPRLRLWLSPRWTMALLICKDAVLEPMPQLLSDVRANLVMVPCLSFKMDAFRAAAQDVATRSQGIALIANAAVAPRGRRAARPDVVLAVPSQAGSVISTSPPPRSLVTVTLGKRARQPEVDTL